MIGLSGGNDVPRADVDGDRRDVQAKHGTQSDVTHIFREARFDHVEGTPEPIDTNVAMFRNSSISWYRCDESACPPAAVIRIMACIKDNPPAPARVNAPGFTHSMIGLIYRLCGDPKGLGLLFSFPVPKKLFCAVSMYRGAAAREGDGLDGDRVRVHQSRPIPNGDLFRWSNRWPKFADYFGMALGPSRPSILRIM